MGFGDVYKRQATVTGKDGSTRKVDVTPDEWRDLPVATQTAY